MDLMTQSARITLKRCDEITVVIESSLAELCSAVGFLMIHRSVNLENFAGRSLIYFGVEVLEYATLNMAQSQISTSGLYLYVIQDTINRVICLNHEINRSFTN